MRDPRRRTRLLQEPLGECIPRRVRKAEDFDRDLATEPFVHGAVDARHPAPRQERGDAIALGEKQAEGGIR